VKGLSPGREAERVADAMIEAGKEELVASFQESRPGAPWPWWRASAADEGVAVRK